MNAKKLLRFNLAHPDRAIALADLEARKPVARLRGSQFATMARIHAEIDPKLQSAAEADTLPDYSPVERGAYDTDTIQATCGKGSVAAILGTDGRGLPLGSRDFDADLASNRVAYETPVAEVEASA